MGEPPPPLQDDRILHHGQYVAVVVAETRSRRPPRPGWSRIGYEQAEPLLDSMTRGGGVQQPRGRDIQRGDAAAGLASAEVVAVEAIHHRRTETNNPWGCSPPCAFWDGDALTVHDATQWPDVCAPALARDVRRAGERRPGAGAVRGRRVRCRAARLAARYPGGAGRPDRGRPVKLVLTRPQMFTGVGHRPSTVQHIRIGGDPHGRAGRDRPQVHRPGRDRGHRHRAGHHGVAAAYACPNVVTRDQQARLNIPSPASMRAPGEAQGNFALESAVDELSYALGIDPLELRLRNYAEAHPQSGLPWSSKALRECYKDGAERFGWSTARPPAGSMRDGRWLVGYGMAGVSYRLVPGALPGQGLDRP